METGITGLFLTLVPAVINILCVAFVLILNTSNKKITLDLGIKVKRQNISNQNVFKIINFLYILLNDVLSFVNL
jgi:hypothetical protein